VGRCGTRASATGDDSTLDLDHLPIAQAAEVDRVCDRFRAERATGRAPRIEDELAGAAEAVRRPLLGELLRVELELRREAGEQPTSQEYRRRFPGDAAVIDAVFLETVELTPDRASSPGRIGKYDLVRLLGRGGQAETYLAFDPDLRRHVVLKLYHMHRIAAQPDLVLREGHLPARPDQGLRPDRWRRPTRLRGRRRTRPVSLLPCVAVELGQPSLARHRGRPRFAVRRAGVHPPVRAGVHPPERVQRSPARFPFEGQAPRALDDGPLRPVHRGLS
jgi:hypothetical protein